MALRDHPYFPFYVQDYLTDERLLMCSWSTQGIYVRILCNLHKQDVYGAFLFKQNSKQSSKQNESIVEYFATILCRLIPCQHSEMENAITELLDNNVLSFDGEKLYQKRMYNDGIVSVKRSEAARKGGGNPVLKSSSKSKNLFKQNSKQNTENEIEYEYDNESINNKGGVGEKTMDVSGRSTEVLFEEFRKLYPGTKRGHDTELSTFRKHKDYRAAADKLLPALLNEIEWRIATKAAGGFCPDWPHLSTWITQRRWEQELKPISNEQHENTSGRSGLTGNERKYGSTSTTKGAIIAEARELDRRRAEGKV